MRAIEAASVLERLQSGGDVELSASEQALVDRLVSAGLVSEAADTGAERERLAMLKHDLAELARAVEAGGAEMPGVVEKQRALRTEILDLSEQLARSDGAARVTGSGSMGPYRGTASAQRRLTLTQRGRALASNLGPRASRAPNLTLEDFEEHMDALRKLFAWRSGRAMNILGRIGTRAGSIEPSAVRTVAIGLSGLRHGDEALADAWLVLYGALRQRKRGDAFSAAHDASAAECLLLTARDPSAVAHDARSADWFIDLRARVHGTYCAGRSDDALDAALLLAAIPTEQHAQRIAECTALAEELAAASVPIPLSLALVYTTGGARDASPLVAAYRTLSPETREPVEALAAATILSSTTADAGPACDRLRQTRDYLVRFAPNGMMVAAAMLGLLEGDAPALLDDLRLASAEVQRYQLATGGAEAMMHAVKLLVQASLLAHGSEGDPEETVALVARALPAAGLLGLGGAAATLPVVLSAVSTFHRPMLDAALVYERAYQPTHSDYVFGSGYGSSYGSGSRSSYHHRSVGWG